MFFILFLFRLVDSEISKIEMINPKRLIQVIQSVLDGAAWFDPKVANVVLNSVSNNNAIPNYMLNSNYNLTDREQEVLEYICEGLNNGEISKILDVSINTVKVHVSSIIQKLGVEDRTQVVVKALRNKHFKENTL